MAITLTHEEGNSKLISERIDQQEEWATGSNPNQLLSEAELANSEQAEFVVGAIKKATDGLYEGIGYWLSGIDGGYVFAKSGPHR